MIILNDEDHTFEYVIEMLIKLFAHSVTRAKDLTWQIHLRGKAIVYTTHKEKAELKCEQIRGLGPDFFAPKPVTFPLGVYIEPLP